MRYTMKALLMAGLALGPLLAPAPRAQDTEGSSARALSAEDWQRKLGLSPDQTARLKAALKTRDDAVEPLRTQLKAAREKLDQQIKDKASDADIQATLSQIDRLRRGVQTADDQLRADLATFLTPTQRAKMMEELYPRRLRSAYDVGGTETFRPDREYNWRPSDYGRNVPPEQLEGIGPVGPGENTVPTQNRPSPGPDLPSLPDNRPFGGTP